MKVIGSKTSFQNHQPSKLHFVSGADEKRKFCRPDMLHKIKKYYEIQKLKKIYAPKNKSQLTSRSRGRPCDEINSKDWDIIWVDIIEPCIF